MLDAIKRWISGGPPGPDWPGVSSWAQTQGYGFKRAKDDQGFVIDGAFGTRPWRLEWGPPQRAYIPTTELRLRMELQLPSDLQMLVMSRPLMETLERETFDRFTESNQTQIDVSTPEEMRWLAMYPKVPLDELSKTARAHFGAVAVHPKAAASWIDASVAEQLGQAAKMLLREDPPFVLMTLRGRVYLRMQLDDPEPSSIAQAVALFQAGAQAAERVGGRAADKNAEWPSTASSAWQTQMPPEDSKPPES
jgi:hypothetical protein